MKKIILLLFTKILFSQVVFIESFAIPDKPWTQRPKSNPGKNKYLPSGEPPSTGKFNTALAFLLSGRQPHFRLRKNGFSSCRNITNPLARFEVIVRNRYWLSFQQSSIDGTSTDTPHNTCWEKTSAAGKKLQCGLDLDSP